MPQSEIRVSQNTLTVQELVTCFERLLPPLQYFIEQDLWEETTLHLITLFNLIEKLSNLNIPEFSSFSASLEKNFLPLVLRAIEKFHNEKKPNQCLLTTLILNTLFPLSNKFLWIEAKPDLLKRQINIYKNLEKESSVINLMHHPSMSGYLEWKSEENFPKFIELLHKTFIEVRPALLNSVTLQSTTLSLFKNAIEIMELEQRTINIQSVTDEEKKFLSQLILFTYFEKFKTSSKIELIEALHTYAKSLAISTKKNAPPYWSKYRKILNDARKTFESPISPQTVAKQQQNYAIKVDELLITIFEDGLKLLHITEPVCFLKLGSFVRGKPGPFSDIEGILLYQNKEDKPQIQLLAIWLEWMMESLGENIPSLKLGLHFDDSQNPCRNLVTIHELKERLSLTFADVVSGITMTLLETQCLAGNKELYETWILQKDAWLNSSLSETKQKQLISEWKEALTSYVMHAPLAFQTISSEHVIKKIFSSLTHSISKRSLWLSALHFLSHYFDPDRKEITEIKDLNTPWDIKKNILQPMLYLLMDKGLSNSTSFVTIENFFSASIKNPAYLNSFYQQILDFTHALRCQLQWENQSQPTHNQVCLQEITVKSKEKFVLTISPEQAQALLFIQQHCLPYLYQHLLQNFNVSLDNVLPNPVQNFAMKCLSQKNLTPWHDFEDIAHTLDASPTFMQKMNLALWMPDEAGNRVITLQKQINFDAACESILLKEAPKDSVIISLELAGGKKGYLPVEIVQQILDSNGDIKKQKESDPIKSRHRVAPFEYKTKKEAQPVRFHVKQKPDHAMMDKFVYLVKQRLIGHGAANSTLGKLFIENKSKNLKTYPVLFSETIGKSKDNLSNHTQEVYIHIQAFTELLIAEILLRPGDSALRNWQRNEIQKGDVQQNSLTDVDNDQVLVEPLVKLHTQPKLQIHSSIFSLKQMLSETLDTEALAAFCELNLLKLVEQCLDELDALEPKYVALFPSPEEQQALFHEDKDKNRFTPYCLLPQGGITQFLLDGHLLQGFIKAQLKLGLSPTGTDLINRWNPRVAKYYLPPLNQPKLNLKQRFQQATDNAVVSVTSSQSLQATLGRVPSVEEVQIHQRYSPRAAKTELNVMTIEPKQFGPGVLAFMTDTFEQEGIHAKADFTSLLDFQKKPDLKRQQSVLRYLTFSSFVSLELAHCAALEDAALELVLAQSPKLQILNLTNCKGFSSKSLPIIASLCPELKELYISLNSDLEQVCGYSQNVIKNIWGSQIQVLRFPQLKILHCASSPKLQQIWLDAPALRTLKVNKNPSLKTLKLITPELTEIDASETGLTELHLDTPNLTHLNASHCLVLNSVYTSSTELVYVMLYNLPHLASLKGVFKTKNYFKTLVINPCPEETASDYRNALILSGLWSDTLYVALKQAGDIQENTLNTTRLSINLHSTLHLWRNAVRFNLKTIQLPHWNKAKITHTLKGHTNWIKVLITLPKGNLASGSADCSIRIWDANDYECLAILKKDDMGPVTALAALSKNRLTSGSGAGDYAIRIWDLNTNEYLATLKGHTSWVNALTTLVDDNNFASGSSDCTIRIWDANNYVCLFILKSHGNLITSLTTLFDGTLVSASANTIRFWDLKTRKCRLILSSSEIEGRYDDYQEGLLITYPDGNLISSVQTLRIWDSKTYECLTKIKRPLISSTYGVSALTILPNNLLVAGTGYYYLFFWHPLSGELVATLPGHENPVASLATLRSGFLASGTRANDIYIWEPELREFNLTPEGFDWKDIAWFGLKNLFLWEVPASQLKAFEQALKNLLRYWLENKLAEFHVFPFLSMILLNSYEHLGVNVPPSPKKFTYTLKSDNFEDVLSDLQEKERDLANKPSPSLGTSPFSIFASERSPSPPPLIPITNESVLSSKDSKEEMKEEVKEKKT